LAFDAVVVKISGCLIFSYPIVLGVGCMLEDTMQFGGPTRPLKCWKFYKLPETMYIII
jgi:hypothetical protein